MRSKRFIEVFFLVRGSGEFPIDMLRYDSCHPRREQDSYLMASSGKRVILMRRFAPEEFKAGNEARWKAFGWEAFAWTPNEEKLLNHPDLKG